MGENCIPGKGCAAVIEMAKNLETALALSMQAQKIHSQQSGVFWEEQKAHVDEIADKFSKCFEEVHETSKQFIVGANRMEKGEEAHDTHENGKFGAHSLIQKTLFFHRWGIVISLAGLAGIGVFLSLVHPGFIDFVISFI